MIFYPLVATVISAIFAATLWRQYRRKPRAYLLAWSIALAVYAVAALTEVIGAAGGWSPMLYRIYYFFGGITVVDDFGHHPAEVSATMRSSAVPRPGTFNGICRSNALPAPAG